jgi:hypothetical protein
LRRYEPTTRLAVEGASTKKASRLDLTLERPVLAERGKSNAQVVALSDEKVLLKDVGHALGSLHL